MKEHEQRYVAVIQKDTLGWCWYGHFEDTQA